MSKLILIYLLTGCLWCKHAPEKENDSIEAQLIESNEDGLSNLSVITDKKSDVQPKLDSLSVLNFLSKHPEFSQFKKQLIVFYKERDFANAWIIQHGVAEHTFALYNKVLQLIDHDIPYEAPYLEDFKSIMENRYDKLKKNETEKEILISCHYLYYIKYINTNLTDKAIESLSWLIIKKRINPGYYYNSLLADTIENKNLLYPQFYLLLDALKTYSTAKKSGKWNFIKPNKKQFKPLDSSYILSNIRTNLFLLGDLVTDSGDSTYDAALTAGVYSFQKRHGLKKKDIIDAKFIRLMNIPLQERIEQILINMERCKWLPNEQSNEYIIVNIPQFSLHAFSSDSLVFTCKVVVGKETNQTMIFKGDMKYVVFSPYWNVPESILKKEILPAIQKNPNYLRKNNMEWFNGSVRQRPGETNALGRVKFIFPNTFNIYLHDTPSKNLFDFEKRTFSHGCIRISEPMKMAKFLLRNDTKWDEQKITDAMLSEKELTVKLEKAIPVYVVYFTSFVDEQGKLNFREDIYDRDNSLKQILFNKKPFASSENKKKLH